MRDAISEIVGRGKLDDGHDARVYRALRALLCSTCGAVIAQNSLFTRRGVKGFGLNIMPQCRKCAPFALLPEEQEKSALLQALLREPAVDSEGANVPEHEAAPEDQKNIAEEVRRRLGPALKKTQRKIK